MLRYTGLPRLSVCVASTVAALAAGWSTAALAQHPDLASPPPVTASQPDVILTASRLGRGALRNSHVGHAQHQQPAPAVVMQPVAPVQTVDIAPVDDQFRTQLDLAIEVSSRRYLRANEHSPWQIFHGLLALKQDFQLYLGTNKVNAIQWIATSEPRFDNQPLLMKTPHGGKFHSFTRPYAFEGHPAQFLALLSQSDLPVGFSFRVGRDKITIGDIIHNTMKEVNAHEEVTWVLWALQHYLKTDAQWLNQHNEQWSIERLVQIETAAPVVGAPCGGNHRLFALTRTRDKHLKHGGQLVGVWAQADYKVRQHIEIARSLQNYDGTFSSRSYETSGHTADLNQRFNTTGHTMEFLSIALPNDRLDEPWVRSAVNVLCNDLVNNRQRQIDCGPLYHTLNSLIIYRERYQAKHPSTPAQASPEVADSTGKSPAGSAPVVAGIPADAGKTLNAKPVTNEKSAPTNSVGGNSLAIKLPGVQEKGEPTSEALNELKLDAEFRNRLNALTSPRPLPIGAALPLEAAAKLSLEVDEQPVSALKPDNR